MRGDATIVGILVVICPLDGVRLPLVLLDPRQPTCDPSPNSSINDDSAGIHDVLVASPEDAVPLRDAAQVHRLLQDVLPIPLGTSKGVI